MSLDYLVYLRDMLSRSQDVLGYMHDVNYDRFVADIVIHRAACLDLMYLGEASKHVPADVRSRYPGIPWRRIAGLRDVLIHQYLSVDLDVVWDIIQKRLPGLRDELQVAIPAEEERQRTD